LRSAEHHSSFIRYQFLVLQQRTVVIAISAVVVVVYADNTPIVVSSVVGAVALIALICLFQFIR